MRKNDIFDLVVQHVVTVPDKEFANLSVGTIAYSFDIDRYKLLRHFKRQTDMTLEDFLFKQRMTRAAYLLKSNSDITVTEVSQRVGYSTCDYFIRKFREFYGIVPGKYRALKNHVGEEKYSYNSKSV